MIRDPSSADANAQAPQGHPDAQVRIDTSSRLAGTQQPKLPAGAPMAPPPAPPPAPDVPAPSQDPNAAPSETAAAAPDVPAAPGVQPEPPADPIPTGEVTPDTVPSAASHDADTVG